MGTVLITPEGWSWNVERGDSFATVRMHTKIQVCPFCQRMTSLTLTDSDKQVRCSECDAKARMVN